MVYCFILNSVQKIHILNSDIIKRRLEEGLGQFFLDSEKVQKKVAEKETQPLPYFLANRSVEEKITRSREPKIKLTNIDLFCCYVTIQGRSVGVATSRSSAAVNCFKRFI
jgi:hypothetical protein